MYLGYNQLYDLSDDRRGDEQDRHDGLEMSGQRHGGQREDAVRGVEQCVGALGLSDLRTVKISINGKKR